MSPPSSDPEKRQRQLANLPNLRGEPTRGSWRPGASPNLEHGLRSRRPGPAVLDPLAREIEEALVEDLPVKGRGGGVPAPDRFMVELAAIALLRVRRCAAYLELYDDVDERGNLRPAFIEFGKAVEHAARMLDRLGMSPRARAALGADLGLIAAREESRFAGKSLEELEQYLMGADEGLRRQHEERRRDKLAREGTAQDE